jgi:two-component system, NtrC family, response regulator HydG
MESPRVLVVEDNDVERKAVAEMLRLQGFAVSTADGIDRALGYLNQNIHVILCDLNLGNTNGMELLHLWKSQSPRTPIIFVTGLSTIAGAVEAIKAGAFDYLAKPLTREKLAPLLHLAVELAKGKLSTRSRLDPAGAWGQIIGGSPQMRQVLARVQRAAMVASTVLILGENGTGKDLVAQALHHISPRREGPFVAMNVAAVPATLVESELFGHVRGAFTGATDRRIGRFEQANGGTLFIDEIGDFDLTLQPKLLRVLETFTLTPVGGHEDRKVDVRIVAATSRNLQQMVREGKFREDLYYRLHVVCVNIPPLRRRTEDIPILVEHFLKEINTAMPTAASRLSPEVMRRFLAYPWPGNVRELHNTLESMMVLADGDELTESDLPEHILGGPRDSVAGEVPSGLTMEALEKLAIQRALAVCGGNRTHAAKHLNISVRTLQRKLQEYAPTPHERPANGDVLS